MKANDIGKLDKNFAPIPEMKQKGTVFIDVREEPFEVYGLYDYKNQKVFKRVPDEVAIRTSSGVAGLALHTSGGRVRCTTTSSYIALKVKTPPVSVMAHMPILGIAGFDMYIDKDGKSTYFASFMPPCNMQDGYESYYYFDEPGEHSITIHFPLYHSVNTLYIGVEEDATISAGAKYENTSPIVFYGSSITQGGCASRPGNAYPAMISRRFNRDFINLGFSGNAKGEPAMMDYIAGLDMSIFVYDYDHNAPNPEHLANTHEPFFKGIRDKHPDLPIIMVSKPDFDKSPIDSSARREIIKRTYANAILNKDKNVYFIDGESLFGRKDRDACTVDRVHPNDLGFYRMAVGIGDVIARILNSQK